MIVRLRGRILAGLAVLAAALLALLVLAPAASAHAVVVGSDPTDGQRLASPPAKVTIRFDEAVGLSLGYLRVVDAAGRRVDAGTVTHPGGVGSSISVALKPSLPDGTYLASFRVVSADSHPVIGSLRFVIGNGPLSLSGTPASGTTTQRSVTVALAVVHWLSFAGVGLVGGCWLVFSIWPSGQRQLAVRRAVWAGWIAAVAGAVGEFLLQGPYAAGTGLATIGRTELLDATLHVNSGQLLSLRLVLIGVLGLVLTALFTDDLRRRPSWGPEAAAMVGVGIVVTYAATGHSQSANPRWLAVLVDSLHLSAMIVWLGGLAILVVAAFARSRPAPADPDAYADADADDDADAEADDADADAAELAAGLPIFSRVALGAVVTLAVTGTVQAWREVGTVDAITTTMYGRLVVAKVALFIGLVVLGYFARRIVQRRDWTQARSNGPLTRMRRALLVEVIVGAAVLGVTGVLIAQPPGKVALAAERSKPVSATVVLVRGGASAATVAVNPGRHGAVDVQITITGGSTPTAVSATAALPGKQLGPYPLKLVSSGARSYSASGLILPSAGTWQLTLTVQTSEFDAITAVAQVHLS
ncbi:copper resistance protein CopC/CopD [Jatrophihabitans telluris]|uniref:Copper resistance protein CopC/CopD n=1 Tax=Jatrophihabitans telluris TaxID=2038343 RepID=A0ABY4QWF3_9ACTN|nr:copper resistance protein CopC [Jatrophihabitans telluris]UQX87658.1 copper resistance protein CopC/CopD [Jatrophihabitans telluris]